MGNKRLLKEEWLAQKKNNQPNTGKMHPNNTLINNGSEVEGGNWKGLFFGFLILFLSYIISAYKLKITLI